MNWGVIRGGMSSVAQLFVAQGIYIEDTLYVISGNIIEAYDMNTGVKSGDIIL